jgi:hypothetical protein
MRRQPKTPKSQSGKSLSARVSDLEREVGALREALARIKQPQSIRHRDPSAKTSPAAKRKLDRDVAIAKAKAMGLVGLAIPLVLDNKELEPRAEWTKDTGGLRLWAQLYNARRYGFPKTQRAVRKYIRIVQPFQAMRPAATKGKGEVRVNRACTQGLRPKSNKSFVPARAVSLA